MKRWIAGILVLLCLAPLAAAEQPDDEFLLSFYNDSVFFGDSITKALRRYRSAVRQTDPDFMPSTDIICTDCISLFAGSRTRLTGDYHFQYRGRESTMYDITAQIGPKKVFILLGLNDPAGSKIEKAIGWVEDIIRIMAERFPETEVYFFSNTPVALYYCREKNRPDYPAQVNEYNARLKETCEAKGAHYVEIAEPMKDENGYLNLNYSSDDRCHLSDEGVKVWIECLKDYAREQYELGLWDPFAVPEEPVKEGA